MHATRMLMVAAVAGAVLASAALPAQGAAPVWVARVLRELPRTPEAMAEAHEASQFAATQIAVGEPLEVPDFGGSATYTVTVREDGERVRRDVHFDVSRRSVLSYGMLLTDVDRDGLPVVSKERIMGRIGDNYIAVQLRLQRDTATGAVYLYYKPYAAVGHYREEGTHQFAPLMESSVRDFRSLGLFVKAGTPITAEAFRTFVAINKNVIGNPEPNSGKEQLVDRYEYFFCRARVEGDDVALHSFGTIDKGETLEYMVPYASPGSAAQCSVISTIFFTEYTVAKQSPSAKAARDVAVRSKATIPKARLDAYARQQGWEGDAWDNLSATLDAVIDGKIE